MTEKRFIETLSTGIVTDTVTGKEYQCEMRIDDKLLELLNQISDENEQLKQTIKGVCELLEEEVDLFSDKATEHDICAYIELKEFDNKDAYYMATATKKAIKILKGCLND